MLCCAPSPNAPYPGQLPGLPKEGSQVWAFSSCLHSSRRPQAQEFTFHSLGFSSHGGEAKQLKRRLGFLRACLYSFFFFFSVNIIQFGKGSKNTIVARSRDGEGEGESIDLYAYIVMDKTDSLLFACFWRKKKNKTLTLGFWAASPKMYQLDYKLAPRLLLLSSRLVSRAQPLPPQVECIPETTWAAARWASSGALWLQATRHEGELIFPFTCL